MKFNVFFKKDHGAHWVLSNGSAIFESFLFKTMTDAMDNLEEFVTLMQSPVLSGSDELVNFGETKTSPSALVIFKQKSTRWYWDLFISTGAKLSKVAECSDKGFDSLEQARQKAKSLCDSIVKAPILDWANVAIPGCNFSKTFENEHHIKDIHPSSKWIK